MSGGASPSTVAVLVTGAGGQLATELVRTAGGTAVLTAVADPQVVSIWIPEPLLPRLVEPVTVEAIVGEGFLASPVGAVTEVPVALPAEMAAVVGRARIDPVRVRVRSMQP